MGMGTGLADIFTSSARTAVIETLSVQQLPVHLRLIGSLTQRPIHSIELALAQLQAEGLVIRKQTKQRALFSINRNHPQFLIIEQVMTAVVNQRIREQSEKTGKRAKEFLPFIKSSSRMIETARRSSIGSR